MLQPSLSASRDAHDQEEELDAELELEQGNLIGRVGKPSLKPSAQHPPP